MYKLIAIDLDGTLLDSYGDVSIDNKKALENAKKNNIEVVLTSGRMSTSVKGIAEETRSKQLYNIWKWCFSLRFKK